MGSVVVGLSIESPSTKAAYDYGEEVDLEGLVANLSWSDGTSALVVFIDFGDNISTDPHQGHTLTHDNEAVTVTHTDSGESDTFTISVNVIMTSVSVGAQPQLEYTKGNELDLSDIVMTLGWSDGMSTDVTLAQFEDNGLVAAPAHGRGLTVVDYHGTAVTVTYDGDMSTDTETLTWPSSCLMTTLKRMMTTSAWASWRWRP